MKRFLESLQMLALVLVFCLFTLQYGKALPKLFRHPHFKHVIIIDAGSTGTRCHVFRVAATSSITTTTYVKDASVTPKLILSTKSFLRKPLPKQLSTKIPYFPCRRSGLRKTKGEKKEKIGQNPGRDQETEFPKTSCLRIVDCHQWLKDVKPPRHTG